MDLTLALGEFSAPNDSAVVSLPDLEDGDVLLEQLVGEIGKRHAFLAASLSVAMPFVFPSKKIFDIERLALTCVEGANPFVDLGAQLTQLLDV